MSRPGQYDEVGLARLSADQDQVVSRDQLAYLGFDRHHVAHRVRSGRWQVAAGRVVVL